MSSIFDMISAFIAMLMSAAFLHFGASGDSRPATPPSASHTIASAAPASPSIDPVAGDSEDTTAAPAPAHPRTRRHCHAASGAPPMLDTVRTPSPLRHG